MQGGPKLARGGRGPHRPRSRRLPLYTELRPGDHVDPTAVHAPMGSCWNRGNSQPNNHTAKTTAPTPTGTPSPWPGSLAETVGSTGKGTGGGCHCPPHPSQPSPDGTHIPTEDSCVGTAFPVAPSSMGTSHTEFTAQVTWCLAGSQGDQNPPASAQSWR